MIRSACRRSGSAWNHGGVDLLEALGTVMHERRRQLGLSQETLAFETEIHRTYISAIERGTKGGRNPSLRVVERLAEGLDMELPKFLRRMAKVIEED